MASFFSGVACSSSQEVTMPTQGSAKNNQQGIKRTTVLTTVANNAKDKRDTLLNQISGYHSPLFVATMMIMRASRTRLAITTMSMLMQLGQQQKAKSNLMLIVIMSESRPHIAIGS